MQTRRSSSSPAPGGGLRDEDELPDFFHAQDLLEEQTRRRVRLARERQRVTALSVFHAFRERRLQFEPFHFFSSPPEGASDWPAVKTFSAIFSNESLVLLKNDCQFSLLQISMRLETPTIITSRLM